MQKDHPEASPDAGESQFDCSAQNKPLKICLLGYRSHPYGGGQGVYINYLSKALVEAGHTVEVISGPPYPILDPRVRLIEMPSLDLFANGLGSLRLHHIRSMSNIIEWMSKLTGGFAEPYTFGRRVVKYLKVHGKQYDLIHDNQSLSYGMLELQRMGLPLVTTLHHPITSDLRIAVRAASSRWHRLLIRRWHSFLLMQKQVVSGLHHIVTVSERSRQDIAKDFGIEPGEIHLVYNGIDTDVFAPRSGIVPKPFRLMATASADQPLKGLRYLLEAFALILPQYPQLELLLVSKPKPEGDTERLIDQLGIREHIIFVHGISTEDMVDYYAEASIAVVPSVYEGFGLPAGEAMACGVPVVSTDGGALPEVVGDASLVVPTRNSAALAGAITTLLDNPELREEFAEKGRLHILENFSWRVVARQMTGYYREVLSCANS